MVKWRDIKGFKGLYQVSNTGLVRSIRLKPYKVLSLSIKPNGYVRVTLSKGGLDKSKYIHRLVAEAFLPNPEGKPQVNHKDRNKLNNSKSNLEWMTSRENIRHARDTSLSNNTCNLTLNQVIEIEGLLKEGKLFHREIASIYNVNRFDITDIATGRRWSEVVDYRAIPKKDKKGKNNPKSKAVVNCRGEVFSTITEASIKLKVDYSTLRKALNGKGRSAGKYSNGESIKWKYYILQRSK